MKIKWLGHSAFLLEGSKRILIDPFITDNPIAKVNDEDTKNIDYIALTHDHGDHMGDTEKIAKSTGAKVVTIYEISLDLQAKGVDSLGMNIGGTAYLEGASFSMTPAMHSSGKGTPTGFVIEMDGKKVYHTGDTGLFATMSLIGEMYSPDVMLLPIDGLFNMDIRLAAKAVELVKPKIAIPMHYNTWDPIKADPEEFKKLAEKFAEIRILELGTYLEI